MTEVAVISEADVDVKNRLDSPGWTSWSRYSYTMLRTLEKKILQYVKTAYKGFYVDVGPVVSSADKIWTISLNTESTNTPLVLLHGLGAGVALWCPNLDSLAQNRPVYAIDILGFGRSSRPKYSTDAMEAEQQFVKSIEEWRRETKLQKIILLGHSMGGFLATSYAINYPDRVKHLILADPWGFPEQNANRKSEIPILFRVIAYAMRPLNPLATIRFAGPFGSWVINAVRPDIAQKYTEILDDESLIPQYIYQCNAQTPSGETAFRSMMHEFGWAKHPMVHRVGNLRADVPVTILYGSRSWLDHSASEIVKEKRMQSYVRVQVIAGAGHHLYADKPKVFNQIVNEVCNLSDENKLSLTQSPSLDGGATKDASLPSPEVTTDTDNKPLSVPT